VRIWQKPWRHVCISFFVNFPLFLPLFGFYFLTSEHLKRSCLLLSFQTGNKEDIEKFSKRTVKVGSLLSSLYYLFSYVGCDYCGMLALRTMFLNVCFF
jgi:hypothetical protein